MRIPLIFVFGLFSPLLVLSQKNQKDIPVTIRIVDAGTGKTTPAMVCITSEKEGRVRIPSSSAFVDSVSQTKVFYRGVQYSKDRNWTGPIRKMNGQGNNDDRSYVYEMLPSLPYWKAPVMYQVSGDFTIALPAGKWNISVEHGNEFIPVNTTLTLTKKDRHRTLTLTMTRWINLPAKGWYSGDVHVHHPTTQPTFKDYLLSYAQAEDVHLVNTLEMGHHLGRDFRQEGFGKPFQTCRDAYCLVSGQEDPRSTYGHIIGLNVNAMVRDTTLYNYYDVAFKNIHKQAGALVGFAHFSWNGCDLPRGFPWYVTTGELDFVELLQFAKINTSDYYDYLNMGFKFTAAAGSDIPWGSTLGEVRTFVYTGPTFTSDRWFEGLRAGHTFVSNGPALFLEVDGKLPGSELVKKKGETLTVSVKALTHSGIGKISHVALYSNEGLVAGQTGQGRDSIQWETTLTVAKSQWIAARVTCENGAMAHTTPIYVVVNGEPTWSVDKLPALVAKQMDAVRFIEGEEKGKKSPDAGILERLENAKRFYEALLERAGK